MKRVRPMALAAIAIFITALGGAPAVQAHGRDEPSPARTHSFSGTCSVEGRVHFSPPATELQQLLHVTYVASGACSGTLDGRTVSDAPVAMHHAVRSNGSCLHAQTVAPGYGELSFTKGPSISYTVEFTYVGSDGVVTFRGTRSGTAVGRGSFLTPNSPPDAAAGCFNGQGVSDLLMDLALVTNSPLEGNARRHP